MNPKQIFITVLIAISLIAGIIYQPFTYENIDAGNAGIKINLYGAQKGVDEVTLVTGRVWYNKYLYRVVEFPTYTQTKDYQHFSVYSMETSDFLIDPKITFSINEKLVPHIYKTYRKSLPEIQESFIRNEIFNSYRKIASKYTADSLMKSRNQFEKQVETDLNERLNKDGFVDIELTAAIDPPKDLKDIIQAKNASIQSRMKAENEVLQAKAEGIVAKTRAEADATAMLVRARAESESNKLRQSALTSLLIAQQYITAWEKGGSQVPQVILGSGGSQMLNLGDFMKKK